MDIPIVITHSLYTNIYELQTKKQKNRFGFFKRFNYHPRLVGGSMGSSPKRYIYKTKKLQENSK